MVKHEGGNVCESTGTLQTCSRQAGGWVCGGGGWSGGFWLGFTGKFLYKKNSSRSIFFSYR